MSPSEVLIIWVECKGNEGIHRNKTEVTIQIHGGEQNLERIFFMVSLELDQCMKKNKTNWNV